MSGFDNFLSDSSTIRCRLTTTRQILEDDFGLVLHPNDLDGAFDEPFEPESDAERQARYDQSAATFEEHFPGGVAEFQRQERITAGVEKACAACGCSESRACLGGCVWATEKLCSRCV